MIKEQNILTLTALFLITSTMFFGVGYAVFDEHQTLVAAGGIWMPYSLHWTATMCSVNNIATKCTPTITGACSH